MRGACVELCIVRLAQRRVGLAIEECKERVAPPARHRGNLMQGAAGKHDGAAHRRMIGLAAELRKDEIAAIKILVEIDRDGEAAMLRADISVVAVAPEMASLS
ncbi:MAG: hypothetical protein WA776_21740 [Xanthobacteraceae bacterium]